MSQRAHWEQVYGAKGPTDFSWYQPEPELSLRMIHDVAPDSTAVIIDVGGGASTLVDNLLDAGYTSLSVLDISAQALGQAKARLGRRAQLVNWIETDVLTDQALPRAFDVWHDRAVFHFLASASDRKRYVDQVRRSVRVGGHVMVATFAPDGPNVVSLGEGDHRARSELAECKVHGFMADLGRQTPPDELGSDGPADLEVSRRPTRNHTGDLTSAIVVWGETR